MWSTRPFSVLLALNTARQKQLGDMLDSCVSDVDRVRTCAAFMAPESFCVPVRIGPGVVLGSASLETPCELEDVMACLKDIPIESIDLNYRRAAE